MNILPSVGCFGFYTMSVFHDEVYTEYQEGPVKHGFYFAKAKAKHLNNRTFLWYR